MKTSFLRATAVAAAGYLLPSLMQAQTPTTQRKALVYCPVTIDSTGCRNIETALATQYPDGIDRGYDGSNATVDLKIVNLWQYRVFVVPSLADNGDVNPYALLRDPVVAERLHDAILGRVAIWSGTPDLGSATSPNRAEKNMLMSNLARWAEANYSTVKGPGLVAFLDQSQPASARYSWAKGIANLVVTADSQLVAYSSVKAITTAASEILTSGTSLLSYSNMATFGLQIPDGAAGVSLDALGETGTNVGGQVVLLTSPGGNTGAAIVRTDKADYSPGTTVAMSGTGWQAAETVSLTLHEDPLVDPDRTFTTTVDANGNFQYTGFAPEPHNVHVRFILTAVGQSSTLRAQTTFTDNVASSSVAAFVFPHPNDWEVFAGDRVASILQVQAPAKAVFIYATSDDPAREAATRTALDNLVQGGTWTCGASPQTIAGHTVLRCAKNNLVEYYLRVPTGNQLVALRDQGQAVTTFDNTTRYISWSDYYATVGAIIDAEASAFPNPSVTVHSFDYDRTRVPFDNLEHTASADAVRATASLHTWNLAWYLGLDSQEQPQNVFGAPLQTKQNTFAAYNAVLVAAKLPSEDNTDVQNWLLRTYFRTDQTAPNAQPPASPATLRGTAISDTRIDLQWADNSPDESGFAIDRGISPNLDSFTEVGRVDANVTTYSDVGLTGGVRYVYRVRAFSGVGSSAPSNVIGVTTPQSCAAPTLTTQPASVTIGLGLSATFSVAAGGVGPFSYQWRHNHADIVNATNASYSIAGATAADAGDYTVVVTNACATSVESNVATLTVNTAATAIAVVIAHPNDWEIFASDRIVPLLQSGASAVFVYLTSAVDGTQLDLGFAKEAGTRAAVDWALPTVSGNWQCGPMDVGTHHVQRCAKGKVVQYYLRLLPVNGLENLRDFYQAQTTIDGANTYPSWGDLYTTVGALVDREVGNITPITSHSLEIDRSIAEFDNPDHTAAGDIARAASSTRTWNQVWYMGNDSQRQPQNVFGDALLTKQNAFAAYDVPVKENDPFIQLLILRTYFRLDQSSPGGQPPAVPTTLRAAAQSSSQIDIQWGDNSADEVGFSIERGLSPNFETFAEVARVGANATSYSDHGLNAGIRYMYRVRAFNARGNSPYSNVVGVNTLDACVAPAISVQPASLTVALGQSASFSVTASSGSALTYQWRHGGSNIGGATASAYQIAAATASDGGGYDVVVSNGCGSITSTTANLTVTGKSTPTLAINSDAPDPSIYGQAITVQFTVSGVAGVAAPTGTVTVSDGTNRCSAAVSAGGCSLTPSSAGAKTLQASYSGDDYYVSSSSADEAHQVSPAPLSVSAGSASRVYGAPNPSFSGTLSGVQNNDAISVSYTTSATTASNVGTYDIVPVLADPNSRLANYAVAKQNGVLTITPALPQFSNLSSPTVTYGTGSVVLSGSLNAGALIPSGQVMITLGAGGMALTQEAAIASDGSFSVPFTVATLSASTYPIAYSYGGSGNFASAAGSASLTINPSSSAVVTANGGSFTYDGAPHGGSGSAVGVNGETLGSVTLTYRGSGSTSYGPVATPPVKVGTYVVTASFAGNTNYTTSASAPAALAITPKPLTVTATARDKVYDGTSTASADVSLTGVVASDAVSISRGEATFANKNVGAGKTVTVAGVTLGGGDAGNYTLSPAPVTATANITARSLTVTVTGVPKRYDGGTQATVTLRDDRVAGDVIAIAYATAAFTDKNVGTAKPVNVSGISVSGADGGNYAANGAATGNADITQRPLAVHAVGVNKTYDGTTSATVTLVDDRVAGDALITSFGGANFTDKNVGLGKTITVTNLAVSGLDANNYSVTLTTSATANIGAKVLSAAISASNKEYDGTTAAVVTPQPLTGVIGGDNVALQAINGRFASKAVGTWTVSADVALTGTDASNYALGSGPVTTGASITPKTLVGSFTVNNKEYDAGTSATVATKSLSTPVSGDAVDLDVGNPHFDSKAAGRAKVVTADLSIHGTDAGNYRVNSSGTATADITPKPLTVTAIGVSKPYDGTARATVTLSDEHLAGDVLTTTYSGANFADKNVGSAKPITVIGIFLSGADKDNYTLITSGAAAANILQRPLAVSATAASKSYDGTSAATVTLADDRISADVLTIGYASANFADKNVGSAKPVRVDGVTLGGADAGNYALASTSVATQADITARPITATADAQTKVFGAIDPPLTYRINSGSLVSGDALAGSLERVPGEAVTGSPYAIQQGTLTAGSNYILAYVGNTLTITPASATLTIDAATLSAVYDGSPKSIHVTTSPASLTADVVVTYGDASIPPTNAGQYQVVATLRNSDYVASPARATLTIGQATQTLAFISAAPVSAIYGGSYTPSVQNGASTSPVILGTATPAVCTVRDGTAAFVGVGDCALSADQAGNANYSAASQIVQRFSVGPATAAVTIADPVAVYDGNPHAATITATGLNGASLAYATTYTLGGAAVAVPKDAGRYIVAASVTDPRYTGSATGTLTINPAPQSLAFTTVAPSDAVFGGSYTPVVSGGASGQAITLGTTTPNVCTVNAGSVSFVGVGQCAITSDQAGNNNYLAAPQQTQRFTIGPATAAIVIGDPAPVYDGKAHAANVTVTGIGGAPLPTSAYSVSYALGGTHVDAPTNAGLYTVTVSISPLYPNYAGAKEGTLTIAAAAITVTADAQTKVYGTADPTLTLRVTSGALASGDQLSGAPTRAPGEKVGNYVIQQGTVSAGPNYLLAFVGAGLTITPAALTPSVTISDRVYDGSTSAEIATRTVSGVVGSDDVRITGGTAEYAGKNVGSAKTVSVIGLTLAGADAANYALTRSTATATATISSRPLAVTASAQPKVYDGTTAAAVTLSDNRVVGDVLTPSYASASFSDPNVGSAKLVTVTGIGISGADAVNYTPNTVTTTTANITKAGQTITFGALGNKTYGDAPFAVSATTNSGLPLTFSVGPTDNCTISGNVATITGAGSCTVTASQPGNSNYDAAANVSQAFTIAKANQTVTFSQLSAKTIGDPAVSIAGSASASSGGTVTYSSTSPDRCTVTADGVMTVTDVGVGVAGCDLTATQAGTSNYQGGSATTRIDVLNKLDAIINNANNTLSWSNTTTYFTVAILTVKSAAGTILFDASRVDPATVKVTGPHGTTGVMVDSKGALKTATIDVNLDGTFDLVLYFAKSAVFGADNIGQKPVVTLNGNLKTVSGDAKRDGRAISGNDSIQITP